MISKPNESGELRISSSGKVYYWQYYNLYNHQFDNDTIEIRDIRNNEVIIKTSPIIPSLESDSNIDTKAYHRLELFNNDTKLLCYLVYVDKDDNRNSKNNFVIYNIQTKEIEYMSQPFSEDYLALSKSYLSPDDKYMIEVSAVKSKARIFDLETKKFEFEFDGEKMEEKEKIGALFGYKFNNTNQLIHLSGTGFYIRNFPELDLNYHFELASNLGIYPANSASYYLCNNELFFISGEKVPGGGSQDYRFWHLKFNILNNEIIYNSKNLYSFKSMFNSFIINNCNKIIVVKDFDNRDGIIACYNYNTLDIEKQVLTSKIYPNPANESVTVSGIDFGKVEIYNGLGKLLLTQDFFGQSQIDVSIFKTGIYIVKVESGGLVKFEKLLISK